MDIHNKPLAVVPFKSYRYKGKYSYIMIGATDIADALNEVKRSIWDKLPCQENLEVWNDDTCKYVDANV